MLIAIVIPRRARLVLVAKPLQVLGLDVHPRRFPGGHWWIRGLGGHEATIAVLGG
jgi:hypothetical protein